MNTGVQAPVRARDLLAIVLETRGAVRARKKGDARARPSWRVSHLDGLEDGAWLELESGATVTVLCRDGGVLELDVSGVVDARRCADAEVRSARAFESLRPDGGRLRAWNESWALEGETRDNPTDYGLRPVLLAPRCPLDKSRLLGCSTLLSLPNQVRWTAVSGAEAYVLRWADEPAVRIDPSACAAASEHFPFAVCAVPWPERWTLSPGASASLEVEARRGLFEGVRSEITRLERLEPREAIEIRQDLAEVTRLGLGAAGASLLSASLYARAELLNETVAALEQAAVGAPSPRLDIALADGLRRLDLGYFAKVRYEAVLAQLGDGGDQGELAAAAHLGLAWILSRWDRREQAESEALLAERLFARLSQDNPTPRPRLLADLAEARSLLVKIRRRGAPVAGAAAEGLP